MKNLSQKLAFALILSSFFVGLIIKQASADSVVNQNLTDIKATSSVLINNNLVASSTKEIIVNREFKLIPLLDNIATRLTERLNLLRTNQLVLIDADTSLNASILKITEAKVITATLNTLNEADFEQANVKNDVIKLQILIKESYALLQETIKNIDQATNNGN